MSARAKVLLGWMATGLAASCAQPEVGAPVHAASAPAIPVAAEAVPPTAAAPFSRELLAALRPYATWKKVALDLGWAAADCAAPLPPGDPSLLTSQSNDPSTHGQKLYHLFARDRDAYLAHGDKPVSPGQVIVKESWIPRAVPPEELRLGGGMIDREGRRYRKGDKGPLFVMMKLDPATEGTDRGWVYGVASPDGEQMIASGKLANCVGCHEGARGDRLLGPPSF